MRKIREVQFFEDHFEKFYFKLDRRTQDKIDLLIELVEHREVLTSKHIKAIRKVKGLYELRVMLGSNCWRIFCVFEENRIVVLLNGFVKKDQKTPRLEIERAQRLMKKYYESKI